MDITALLTSAGINIGLCVLYLSLYSILRKQPGNAYVYFGRQLAEDHCRRQDQYVLERLMPSPSWLMKAWELTDDDILSVGGMDAVVFLRIFVFSIRIFSIAAVVCMSTVLPINYLGQETQHKDIHSESLDVFTIGNVKWGSRWLWVHCVALYIITISACMLLYIEYKSISSMRLAHLTRSPPNPSHFTVLVRAIPKFPNETSHDTTVNFFRNYHGSSYLSQEMIYPTGKLRTFISTVENFYRQFFRSNASTFQQNMSPGLYKCGLCGSTSSLQFYSGSYEYDEKKTDYGHSHSHSDLSRNQEEFSAAFVFFKSRYAAIVASKLRQSSHPMLWRTDLAPEPYDVYWSNLWIPYRQLWIRRLAILIASFIFSFLFVAPVALVQGLTQPEQLEHILPVLEGLVNRTVLVQIVSGYLPSVILQIFLIAVPPMMMFFAAVEGPISRSDRKKSACCKVLYFTIWNVFFVNVLSGSVISNLHVLSSPRGIPILLAKAVPRQATFFITYVLTLGWASLSSEILQLVGLIFNVVRKYIFRCKDDLECVPSFPYHTEIPKVLLFGLIGFTCSILAPLILPFLLVYFFLGYVVYRNQILNVYRTKYETGGQIWPIVHNTTVFSLVLTQIIAIGVFGLKGSRVSLGFTIPLLILTLLFSEYCRQRFLPIFKSFSVQDLINMDREDELSGRMKEIHRQLPSAYCQFSSTSSKHLGNVQLSCGSDEASSDEKDPNFH